MVIKNKLPIILQSEIADCGLACLAMIYNYYGKAISLNVMRCYFQISLKGLTIAQLKSMAEKLRFQAKVLRIEPHQLTKVKLPCIIHWQMNHFIVVKQVLAQDVIVHDPARGIRSLPLSLFHSDFTGIVLELSVAKQGLAALPVPSSPSFIRKFASDYLPWLGLLLLLGSLVQVSYLGSVSLMQYCIDRVDKNLTYIHLMLWVILLFGIKAIEVALRAMRSHLLTYIGGQINQSLASQVMSQLLALPFTFFQSRYLGDIIAKYGSLDKIRSLLTEGLLELFIDAILSIIILVIIYLHNLVLAFVILLSALLAGAIPKLCRTYTKQHHEAALYAKTQELAYFMEIIRAILPIKLFNQTSACLTYFNQTCVCYLNTLTKMNWYKTGADTLRDSLQHVELAVSFAIGCVLIKNHVMTLGQLYAVLLLRQQFLQAIINACAKVQDFHLLQLHLTNLQDLLLEPTEAQGKLCQDQCPLLNPDFVLTISQLCFRYHQDEPWLLYNFNMQIKAGQCVVVTGSSGCGKSTLFKILLGLLPATSGNIYLNHQAIYPKHQACFRSYSACVLQDDVLISGTIADNICFYDPQPDLAYVHYCAQLACLHDDIMALTMGYGTMIGDMGSILSGGQKQRLILARALYKKPKLLLLDEASSHLDKQTELNINHQLRQLNITLIIIAHRQETIAMADTIIDLTKA